MRDPRCDELARHFLVKAVRSETKTADFDTAVQLLAQEMQNTIDTFLGVHLCMRCKALLTPREVPVHDLCKTCRAAAPD